MISDFWGCLPTPSFEPVTDWDSLVDVDQKTAFQISIWTLELPKTSGSLDSLIRKTFKMVYEAFGLDKPPSMPRVDL